MGYLRRSSRSIEALRTPSPLPMDEDDLTPTLPYMLLHRTVEVVTLIVMDICARHTCRRLEDLRSMEVDDEGLIHGGVQRP